MKAIVNSYRSTDSIPVLEYLADRKLAKYFNRETAAAVVTAGQVLRGSGYDRAMPFYYATDISEHEDYGLDVVAAASAGPDARFSQELFSLRGFADVSPLNQFKVLLNMPLSFVSITYQLTGDNAVLYGPAAGLLAQARCAPAHPAILLGAGKTRADGSVEAGFACLSGAELETIGDPGPDDGPVDLLRRWAMESRVP
jgi:hypothetical protein